MAMDFTVTGMTCAACSARVDKAVRSVPGVEDVAVNLLKGTMRVTPEESSVPRGEGQGARAQVSESGGESVASVLAAQQALVQQIEQAVHKAGYEAHYLDDLQGGRQSAQGQVGDRLSGGDGAFVGAGNATGSAASAAAVGSDRAAAEDHAAFVRLIWSIVFTVPLFYLSMGHMFHWPLPSVFTDPSGVMVFALTQFLLLVPVLVINKHYFTNGFSALVHRAPNMNSLIALGAAASTVYGVAMLYVLGAALGAGDLHGAHTAAMDLYFESAAMILTLISVGKYLEARSKRHTTSSLEALMDLSPKTALRLQDGQEQEVLAAEVRVGDVLVVKTGASVPVDGVVLEGEGSVDEQVITGESVPVDKVPGDPVTAATVNKAGWFTMRAERVGADTAIAGIIQLVDEATSSKAPIESLADKISGVFVPVVIGISLVTLAVWCAVGAPFSQALTYAISVLVISCPCALGLATPTAIMVGTGRGAVCGILFKHADAFETTCKVQTVVFDKTGTITTGKPQVTDVILLDNALGEPSEGGAAEVRAALPEDNAVGASVALLESNVVGANITLPDQLLSAVFSLEERSEHPLAQALAGYAGAQGAKQVAVRSFAQIAGRGIEGDILSVAEDEVQGAIQVAIKGAAQDGGQGAARSVRYAIGNAALMEDVGVDAEALAALAPTADGLSQEGKTVLYVACDSRIQALFAIADTMRPTAAATMRELSGMGISTVMLTGDNERTAHAIAAQAGISRVVAHVLPQDKERMVAELAQEGAVGMVGDGINDAPALARATVGIAIGAGTDIAIDSASVVLMHSDPLDVPAAIRLSKATMRIIKQNLFWALVYNALCIPLAAGVLMPFLGVALNPMVAAAAMSFSSVCVVTNALRLRRWRAREVVQAMGAEVVQKEDGSKTADTQSEEPQVRLLILERPRFGEEPLSGSIMTEKNTVQDPIHEAMSQPADQGKEVLMEKTLKVEGMMCQHCVKHVAEALVNVEGVAAVDVDLDDAKAVVTLTEDVPDEVLIGAVESADYKASMA